MQAASYDFRSFLFDYFPHLIKMRECFSSERALFGGAMVSTFPPRFQVCLVPLLFCSKFTAYVYNLYVRERARKLRAQCNNRTFLTADFAIVHHSLSTPSESS